MRTELQDVPPKYVINNDGTISGLSYEIMKLVEKKSGYRFTFDNMLIPLARVMYDIGESSIDVEFGVQRTPEREKKMIFGPSLYQVKIIGVVRADDNVDFRSISDLARLGPNGMILTQNGTGVAATLKAIKGLNIDDGSRSAEASLDKLAAKRGRVVIYHDLTLYFFLSQPKYAGKFKIIDIDYEGNLNLSDSHHFVVYSKKLSHRIVNDINRVIAVIEKSGELKKLTDKYLK